MTKIKDIKGFPEKKETKIKMKDIVFCLKKDNKWWEAEDCKNFIFNQARKEIGELDITFDVKKMASIMQQTQIGTYQSIGEKGKPTPEPKPLFLGNYKVYYGIIHMLATALSKGD